jgi:mannose-1-phosphate guanylyltransferase
MKELDRRVLLGNMKSVNSNNNIVIGNEKPVVIAGLENVFMVESYEMIFIGRKDEMKSIRELKDLIV